jgi:hypothetical protein
VGEKDLLPSIVKKFNANNNTKQTRATRTKEAKKIITAATAIRRNEKKTTKRSSKRKNDTKPSPRQVKLREDALLEVMQGDLGIVVADDFTMRQKRLVTAASKTKVGTPVLQAWTEMKHAIETTKTLHRQRILTAQCLHRACSFTPCGSSGFYSG